MKREQITLAWRPQVRAAARLDDFVEADVPVAPSVAPETPALMLVPMTIERRLLNWAAWTMWQSQSGRGATSITGLICDRMRAASLGNVWSGHDMRAPPDEADALRLERAICNLLKPQRDLLKMHYVRGVRWQIICRHVHIRVSRRFFDEQLAVAQQAVDQLVDSEKM